MGVITAIFLTVVFIGCILVYMKAFFNENENKKLIELHYKPSALAAHVISRCTRLAEFSPLWWASNKHLQTLLTFFIPKPEVEFERQFLQLKDKGILALDWLKSTKKLKKRAPIVIVLPGLTGDAYSVSRTCQGAEERGMRCVVFNKRGHGDSPLTTPKLQSFGDPLDFRQVVKYLCAKYPEASITAIGYSAGSALLASYLGEYGSSTYLTSAVCISPGYDSEALFENGCSQPYHFILLYNLKKLLCKHASALSSVLDISSAMACNTLLEFEEKVYCKMYGFMDMHQYWDKNNPNRDIDEISIPILCINSLDDPICDKELIPFDLFTSLPNFLLAATAKGGHCGFIDSLSTGPTWADKTAFDYLVAVLDFLEQDDKNYRIKGK